MRLYQLIVIGLGLICCSYTAADSPVSSSDVPERAGHEIIRRGDHVQELGTIQAGPDAAIAGALAPPADDSDRWYLTVVRTDDAKFSADCDKLVEDFKTSKILRAWVNVVDPANSWGHYQVRRIGDPTQADWFSGIKDQLASHDYPAVVLQPPRNGSFGQNKVVCGIVHGYDGNAEKLSGRIRDIIKKYSDTMAQKGLVAPKAKADGHAQSGVTVEASAPFNVPATAVDNLQPRNPVVWPVGIVEKPEPPPAPKPLTAKQIKALIPEASPDFRMSVLETEPTNPDQVTRAWEKFQHDQLKLSLAEQAKDVAKFKAEADQAKAVAATVIADSEAKPDPANPQKGWPSSLSDVLVAIAVLLGVPMWVIHLLQRRKAGKLIQGELLQAYRQPEPYRMTPTNGSTDANSVPN